ncbi:MAG: hypothetical protein FJ303_23060 [Planctomycetes bacterium]|nr:hypothetical protein [Planctomycetota bacterium]
METTKTTEAPAPAVDDLFVNTPIGMLRSMQAYMRELPELLANPAYGGWWVAYCGNERIGISRTGHELARKCAARGLRSAECYIGIIAPQDPDEWVGLDLH